ncbi:hypothetical protein [Streptomyces sp. NPDC088196]|uniref:hypothetical protein n=1 Tax=Streptomyces sp. NPDC088196 TaxID=3154868 RepID=UPI00344FE47F
MSRYQFEQVDDFGRILFVDDPALGLECVLGGLETAEGSITLHPAQTPRLPVALFEFRKALGVGYFGYIVPKGTPPDEIPEEPQLEGAILFGMRRLPPDVYCELPSLPGWELHEIPDEQPKPAAHSGDTYSRLELRTPDGEIYSRIWVPYDPEWAAAALRHGYVVCLCGVELGIRGVYAMTAAQHTPAMRHESFRRGCTLGLNAAGLVTYVNHR